VKNAGSGAAQTQGAVHAWLEHASRLDPASGSPTRLLLREAIAAGDADAAVQLLESPSFSWERDYMQAISVGALYWDRGERAAAATLWQRACETNPLALQVLANSLLRPVDGWSLSPDAGAADVLIGLAARTAQREDLAVQAYIDIGRALFLQLGRTEVAREWFQVAQSRFPQDAGVLFHLYAVAMAMNDYAAARPYLDELASSKGRSYWISERDLHLARGGLLLRDPAELVEAVSEFETAVRLAPTSSYARLRLGLAYETAGRTEDAAEQLAAVLKLEPEPGVDVEWVKRHIEELGQ
jgi:tetratricopeptide (TPR) repeat protein